MRLQRFFLVCAALAVVVLGSPVTQADDRGCQTECRQARRMCQRAAYAAHEGCQARCADAVLNAVDRARATCQREALSTEACTALVREATYAASLTCRTDCWQARGRALSLCGEEVGQCREACQDLDPACVQECRSEAIQCRTDLGECSTDCAATVRAGIQECRDQAQETCQIDDYVTCVREARREGSRCKQECHDSLGCGRALRDCIEACPRVSDGDDDDDHHHDGHHDGDHDRDDD